MFFSGEIVLLSNYGNVFARLLAFGEAFGFDRDGSFKVVCSRGQKVPRARVRFAAESICSLVHWLVPTFFLLYLR